RASLVFLPGFDVSIKPGAGHHSAFFPTPPGPQERQPRLHTYQVIAPLVVARRRYDGGTDTKTHHQGADRGRKIS
ncbi:hypothetical protein ACFHW1_28390, partial [Micromonospora sp. LOL_014]|uniref:hypothetical protein n=1 Tax=Micromonospora sp. LOL_014 TaxID=3345415 RepID=UPI003A89C225